MINGRILQVCRLLFTVTNEFDDTGQSLFSPHLYSVTLTHYLCQLSLLYLHSMTFTHTVFPLCLAEDAEGDYSSSTEEI